MTEPQAARRQMILDRPRWSSSSLLHEPPLIKMLTAFSAFSPLDGRWY